MMILRRKQLFTSGLLKRFSKVTVLTPWKTLKSTELKKNPNLLSLFPAMSGAVSKWRNLL